MIEAPTSNYPKLIFRETGNNEQTVRRNGGTPTNVTFDNGVMGFNGTSSKVNYNLPQLNDGTYSVRIRCNPTSFADYRYLLDCRGTDNNGTGYIYLDITSGDVKKTIGTVYVNGSASTKVTAGNNSEIIVSGITLIQGTGSELSLIGKKSNGAFNFLGGIDLVEIYEGTLTASEVANLANNKWNVELPIANTLLDFDATNGYLEDRMGNTLTPSAIIDVVKDGVSYGAKFNAYEIDTGSDLASTNSITFMAWVKPVYYLGTTTLIGNSKFCVDISSFLPLNTINVRSDASTATAATSAQKVRLNEYSFIAVTLTSAGIANIYYGDRNTPPALTGSANQNAGTRVVGTNNIFIGGKGKYTRFQGIIKKERLILGINSINEITQYWSETLKEI